MRRTLLLAVLILALVAPTCQEATSVRPAGTYGDVRVSEIVSVYDGDTFKVNIDCFPPIVGEKISIRVFGIDCPEIFGKTQYERDLAVKAKLFATAMLLGADEVVLCNMRRDKYFRILAMVECDGIDLAAALVAVGYAKPYFGGERPEWKRVVVKPKKGMKEKA